MNPDIILVSQTLTGGGAERVALRLANHWAADGRRVSLVLIRAEGAFMQKLDPRITVVPLQKRRSIYGAFKLWGYLRQHVNSPVLLFGIEVGRVACLGKRLGLVSNRLVYREATNPFANDSMVTRFSYRALINYAECIIAQNMTAFTALQQQGALRPVFHVIPNPVESTQSMRLPPNFDPTRPLRLVAIGRLVAVKGFARLIEALPYVCSRFPGATLDIYGEGPLRSSMERLVKDLGLTEQVRLHGFTSDLETVWKNADVFVLSSHYEGQPNALLEAVTRGVRVIATRAGGGVKELLEIMDLRECEIGDARFAADLAKALSNALFLPSTRWESAVSRFAAMFDPELCHKAYTAACLGDDRQGDVSPPAVAPGR